MKHRKQTPWPVKAGSIAFAVVFFSGVILPTATVASSTTEGYNCPNQNWKYIVGIGGGYAIFKYKKKPKQLPDNR